MNYRKLKSVEPDVLQLAPGAFIAITILEEPHESMLQVGDGRKPPILSKAINLGTGEEGMFIFGAALLSKLMRSYPDGIAGRSFEIQKSESQRQSASGNYYTYRVYEIEPIDDETAETVE